MSASRPVRRVLLVCSGNTCRSPLAEVLLRDALASAGRDDVTVTSAGTGAWDGAPASEGSYLVALERGLDLSRHRARVVTRDMIDDADVILAMGSSHLKRLIDLGAGDKAQLLTVYAGEVPSDVMDPFGADVETYRRTADRLDALLRAAVPRLAGGVR